MEIKVQGIENLPDAATKLLKQHADKKIFAFYGEMGAGKTTFIKAICKHLGVIDETSSPTFAIINQYKSNQVGLVNHFDFYRMEKKQEVFDIGFEDYLYSGDYCLIEWPQIIKDHLPDETVRVEILQTENENERVIRF